MSDRKKILILENDDFLREILGNLLHKKNYYIINGFSIAQGLSAAQGKNIHTVILGNSCTDYNKKHTISHLKKILGQEIKIFIINNTEQEISFIEKSQQMKTSELSLAEILNRF